jgi:hypothetical protein
MPPLRGFLGFVREATREHIRMDLWPRSAIAQKHKDFSPEGFIKNRAATSLLLRRRSMKDILLRRASSAPGF